MGNAKGRADDAAGGRGGQKNFAESGNLSKFVSRIKILISMKKAILSVTNDIYIDQRVDKVCHTLINLGFDASQGFHRYAIEYGNGWINWFIDGKWVYGVNNTGFNAPYGKQMPSHPMQIMVNLWPGTGVDNWLKHFNYYGEKYAYYDYIKYTPM